MIVWCDRQEDKNRVLHRAASELSIFWHYSQWPGMVFHWEQMYCINLLMPPFMMSNLWFVCCLQNLLFPTRIREVWHHPSCWGFPPETIHPWIRNKKDMLSQSCAVAQRRSVKPCLIICSANSTSPIDLLGVWLLATRTGVTPPDCILHPHVPREWRFVAILQYYSENIA